MEKKTKIKYGNVEVSESVLEPKNQKIRISIMIDADVLDAFKEAAGEHGIGYQTLMMQKLRESVEEGLEKRYGARLAALEQVVSSFVWNDGQKEKANRSGRASKNQAGVLGSRIAESKASGLSKKGGTRARK